MKKADQAISDDRNWLIRRSQFEAFLDHFQAPTMHCSTSNDKAI